MNFHKMLSSKVLPKQLEDKYKKVKMYHLLQKIRVDSITFSNS